MKESTNATDIPGFKIRFAKSEDTDTILHFIRQLAEYENLAHEVVATTDSIKNHLFGENPKAEVIIGEFKNDPVAFALFFHNFSTFLGKPGLYLEDLYVLKDVRGQGFGKQMLTYLAKIAVQRGCGRLEWWVLDWNTDAIAFYEKLGAEAMDEWTTYRLSGKALKDLANEF